MSPLIKRKPKVKKPKAPQKSWGEKMQEVGLNPKKELVFAGIINTLILGIAVYFSVGEGQLTPALMLLLLLAFCDYFILSKANRLIKERDVRLESEFVKIFTYFSIYVREGTPVYHALEETRSFASEEMGFLLSRLLSDIDHDKSVAPYIAFSEHFPSLEIRQVLISVYKMVDEGGSEAYIRQFNVLFDGLATMKKQEANDHLKSLLENLCILPMADSGLTMLLISVGVIVVIGGMSNGL